MTSCCAVVGFCVIRAQAEIQRLSKRWTPAFAGVTVASLLALGATTAPPTFAATPDELLRYAQKQKEESAQQQKAREARFTQAHAELKAKHAAALKEVRALEARAAALRRQAEADQQRIGELEAQLGTRGDDSLHVQRLLRVFGRDLRTLLATSPVAAQAPGRDAFLAQIGADTNNASAQDFQKLLALLQQELQASGRIERVSVPVRDGERSETRDVIRVGSLAAFSGGRYLLQDPALGLYQAPRQPGWRDRRMAAAFADSREGLAPLRLDPTGGEWLRALAERPDPTRRIVLAVLLLALAMALGRLLLRVLRQRLLPQRMAPAPWWAVYNRRFFAAVGVSEAHLVLLILLLIGIFGFSLERPTLAKQEVLEVITVAQEGPSQPTPNPGGGSPPTRPLPSIPNLAPTTLTPVVAAPNVNVDVVMPNLAMPVATVGTAMLGRAFGGFGGGGSGGGAGGGSGGGYGAGNMPGGKGKPLIPLSTARPQITDYAYQRGIEGWVVVVYTVGTNGRVSNIRIVDADPKGLFEAVTVESIANWIYEPLDRPREVTQRVEFKLEDYQYNWK
jgi:protein TonB